MAVEVLTVIYISDTNIQESLYHFLTNASLTVYRLVYYVIFLQPISLKLILLTYPPDLMSHVAKPFMVPKVCLHLFAKHIELIILDCPLQKLAVCQRDTLKNKTS